ncbi:hypothetical protein GOP47_0000943 [Adiantum capillus-veneris]|uniref:Magnesium transporter n=1 Tax=Adiantum capillus-veneris TaxID=13818 RepID=A0A9D4ZR02_ADICA|nr:hypothetical protein GOP47_0000943 [Adiantum capillus-veneris]
MARPTSKLAAALRALQTRTPALDKQRRLPDVLDLWVVKQKGVAYTGRCEGNWISRRHCHGYVEPFSQVKLAPKRLSLRIISSKTEADVSKQQENPHEEQVNAGASSSSRDERNPFSGGVKYSVIRINDIGTWEPLILNTSELGVHAKDLDLLAGNFFIPKRSAIAVRNNQILIRMENVRALICKNHCLLFDAHRPRRESLRSSVNGFSERAHHAREAFASLMADHAKQLLKDNQNQLPFHLRMIECLLDETCSFFHQKVERLKLVADRILEELTTDVSTGGLQRLLPLKRALTEVEHDVRDTHEAMDQILGSDDALDALCLRDGQQHAALGESQKAFAKNEQQANKIRQAAADLIVSYQREIDDAGGALEEMRKGMDSAQEVWELGLDTTRNRIITMNLYISIATVTLSLATVPASYFGMNLMSGIEDHPSMFYWVMGATSALAFTCFIGLIFFLRVVPTFKDKRRAQDLAALRDLLQHMDAIDDIFQTIAGKGESSRMTREHFEQILKAHSSTQFVRKRELDLIFRMFDGNRNRMLEASEWNTSSQKNTRQRGSETWGKDL